MGELIKVWADIDDLELFTPNCSICLMPMVPGYLWTCGGKHDETNARDEIS